MNLLEWGEAHARKTDPGTSHAAAASVYATDLENAVLMELRANGPGTTEDLAERLALSLVSVSPRLNPLLKKGLVEKNGTAKNKSGRSAIVWRARCSL